MKKILLFSLVLCLMLNLIACNDDNNSNLKAIPADQLKVGFLYVGSAADKGYTYTHDKGRQRLVNELGVKTLVAENVTGDVDVEKVVIDLISQGCNVIYGTSFEFMEGLSSAAQKYPNVYFGHATGYMQLKNMSTYMGRVYEARYLSGIVAGLNTKTNIIGYVAAMPIIEVIRGIDAFALGVKSVNKKAIVEVEWTNSWDAPMLEKELAFKLIDKGADIITQHTNTQMPQIAASERGVFSIGYNSSSYDLLPDSYLTAPLFNWDTYYFDDVSAIINGTWEPRNYYEGLTANMVALDKINEKLVTSETIALVEKAKKEIMSGKLNVFSGPIYDNSGELRVPKGKSLTLSEIHTIAFFVDNVVGNRVLK